LHIEASWKIPIDAVPEQSLDESIEQRIKREEMTHTGRLKLKVLKAENLRSGDNGGSARMKLMSGKRSADPYVIGYQLNEASGEWKHSQITKMTEHILKTNVKKGTLNPEWNEEFQFDLKTGAFEQKTKQKWHMSLTKNQQKNKEAELAMSMMEQDEVRLSFGDAEREGKNGGRGEPGARHRVKIYLGDTIRQFKDKLMLACRREAEREPDPNQAQRYRSVQITSNHVVTVFVPSDRLRSLFNQARSQAAEYKRLYKLEEQDPAFWQPLDPIRTFNNYASSYGFGLQIGGGGGKDPAQRLRIAEVTEQYKMRNQRYKHFEEETSNCTLRVDETDDSKFCYGHGMYTHTGDGNTTEWRPVLIDRPNQAGDMTKRTFGVKWLYAMGGKDLGEINGHADLDEESVILAPSLPKILGSGTLEHQQFLEEAPDLQEQGLSDHDIAAKLNEKLKLKFELAKEADERGGKSSEIMMPAAITVSEVQHYFKRLAHEGVGASPSVSKVPDTGGPASTMPQMGAPAASSGSSSGNYSNQMGGSYGGGVGLMTTGGYGGASASGPMQAGMGYGGPSAGASGPMQAGMGYGYGGPSAGASGPMQAGMAQRGPGSMGALRG